MRYLAVLMLTACTTQPLGRTIVDLGVDDLSVAQDMSVAVDLDVPPRDMTTVQHDLTAGPDMAVLHDLSPPPPDLLWAYCGLDMETCCAGDMQCSSGMVCIATTCTECGTLGHFCCWQDGMQRTCYQGACIVFPSGSGLCCQQHGMSCQTNSDCCSGQCTGPGSTCQ